MTVYGSSWSTWHHQRLPSPFPLTCLWRSIKQEFVKSFLGTLPATIFLAMRNMSDGEVRKVSRQDIQLVQNLIERCLQLYMNQKEVVETLEFNARIEPGFTELGHEAWIKQTIWQKLEEENREFFKAYHVRLMLKNQITIFNQLLQKQIELMHGMHPVGDASVCLHGDSNASLQQTPSCYTSSTRPDSMPCPPGHSSILVNGGQLPSLQSMTITDTNSLHAERIDLPMGLLSSQSSQMAMLHGMNGTTIKMEPTYSSNSEFTFCTDNSFSEGRPATGDAHLPAFSGTELNGSPLNESLLDVDASSYGILSQIPRNFSFSDLTEDFTQSTDILESYGRSPFLGPESNLSTSIGREVEGERKI